MNILKKSVTCDSEQSCDKTDHTRLSRITGCVVKFIASGFFAGYVPIAQGTVGSLWVPVLFMAAPDDWFTHFYLTITLGVMLAIIILYFLGVWSSGICEELWGHDPGRVVIDEVVGMLVTLVFIPLTVTRVWLGFFLFRVFDVFKPPPVRWSEKLPRGWGVMTDDVIAGIYANVFLRMLVYFFSIL